MTGLAEVLARLEAAEVGTLELDRDIAMLLELLPTRPFVTELAWGASRHMYYVIGSADTAAGPVEKKWSKTAPFYTTSLDAALTLFPEGYAWWEVGRVMSERSPMRAFGDGMPYRAKIGMNWGDTTAWGCSWTAPLSICIAALRAREAEKERG